MHFPMSRPQMSSQLVPFYTNSIDLNTKELCANSARLIWKILHHILERELPQLITGNKLPLFQEHLDRLFQEVKKSHELVNRVISILFDLLQNSPSGINNLYIAIDTDLSSVKLCFVHFTRYYGIKTIQSHPGKFPYRIPYQGEILMDLLGDISQEPWNLYSSFCVNRDRQVNYQIYPNLVSWTKIVLERKLLELSRSHRPDLPPGNGWKDLYFLSKEPWDSRADTWGGIKLALQEGIGYGDLELESYKILVVEFKNYYKNLSPKPKYLTAEDRQEIERRYQDETIGKGYSLLPITWQTIGDKLEEIAKIVRRYYSSPTKSLVWLEDRASKRQQNHVNETGRPSDVDEDIEAMYGEASQPDDLDRIDDRVKKMLLETVGECLDCLKTQERERIEYRFRDKKKLSEIAVILNLKHYRTISNTIDKVQSELTILVRRKFSQSDSPDIIDFINRHPSIFSPHFGFELTANDILTIKNSKQIFKDLLESYYEAI
jgi:hypothetical protein